MELEHHLVAHPGVQDAAVFSVPDPVAGELPRAWIMRKPGYDISQADIHTFINGNNDNNNDNDNIIIIIIL